MTDASPVPWNELEAIIHRDPGGRGVASFLDDRGKPLGFGALQAACETLSHRARRVVIVTGFCIVDAEPAAAETDGPPGALYLARALMAAGVSVVLLSDTYGAPLLEGGVRHWNLDQPSDDSAELAVETFPWDVDQVPPAKRSDNPSTARLASGSTIDEWVAAFLDRQLGLGLSHVVAIERVGPSHTTASLAATEPAEKLGEMLDLFDRETPPEERDECHNMRGKIITPQTAKTHRLFELIAVRGLDVGTIGIGDGGNELGMGSIPWSVLRQAIRVGPAAWTACRIATDHTIVAGVSNWGAYALALGYAALRGQSALAATWTSESQGELIRAIVAAGAVDGVSKQCVASVDGLALDDYLQTLCDLRDALGIG